ncbi:MAG: hypothetical protein M1511_16075, partial [Deltaproteobacteria bacterium]|nr:hypothetical protein [Deltaproteobacteria bacterium]
MNETVTSISGSVRRISLIVLVIVTTCFIAYSVNPGSGQALAEDPQGMTHPPVKPVTSGQTAAPSMDMDMNSGAMSPNMKMTPPVAPRPVRYVMAPEAKMLAEVQTTPVKRQRAFKELR